MEAILVPSSLPKLEIGRVVLDCNSGTISGLGLPIHLTEQETAILTPLFESPGHYHTRDTLLQRGWPGEMVEHGTLYTHLNGLRNKLPRDLPKILVNKPRHGYAINVEAIHSHAARYRTQADVSPSLLARDFFRLLAPKARGGYLGPLAAVTVATYHPIETIKEYAALAVENMLDGITYFFALPGERAFVAIDLVAALAEAAKENQVSLLDEPWSLLSKRLRVYIVDRYRPDSLYVLHSEHDHLAVSYEYSHQEQVASKRADRVIARDQVRVVMTSCVLNGEPVIRQGETIIQLSRDLQDRDAVTGLLEQRFRERLATEDSETRELIFATRQRIIPFARAH